MKHYLNTRLKGKIGPNNEKFYSVYGMFTVNRQTYKYKSRVIQRMLTIEEFEMLVVRNQEGSSQLFAKEESFVEQSIKDSIHNGQFDFELFKRNYTFRSTSILHWLTAYQKRLTISSWNNSQIDWELSIETELITEDRQEDELAFLLVNKYDYRYAPLTSLEQYSALKRQQNDILGLLYVHDWLTGDLVNDLNSILYEIGVEEKVFRDVNRVINLAIEKIKQH
ncbi:MAG: hypothetical protein ACPG21_05190 [Crocinitomicaceae bacterium]